MRLLHVSDLHIGKRAYGVSLLEDQRHILERIVGIARRERVDALLVAGDIYDKVSPSAEAVALFDRFLAGLAAADVKVIAVPGNHDSAERIAYAQGLLEKQGVFFPPVYAGAVEPVELADEHGPVFFWPIPFLKPADVRRFFPDADIGDDYSSALRCVIGACGVDARVRNVAISHQLVTAAGRGPERTEGEVNLGGIDNVDVGAYRDFDYVALGHVHRAQRVGRGTVRYAGSPLKYSFGEARYAKSAVLVSVGRKNPGDAVGSCVSWRLEPLMPLHDMREVRLSLSELLEQGASDAGSRDYLHVTLTDGHPQLDAMARIRAVYPNTLLLDYDGIMRAARVQRARAAADPAQLGMAELFARFFEEQAGKPLDEVQRGIVEDGVRAVSDPRGDDGSREGGPS